MKLCLEAINFKKSEIFFSKNVLHVSESIETRKYLGMPTMIGRKQEGNFWVSQRRGMEENSTMA